MFNKYCLYREKLFNGYTYIMNVLFIDFRDIYIYFSFANNMINLEGEFVNCIPHGNKLYYLNVFDLIYALGSNIYISQFSF